MLAPVPASRRLETCLVFLTFLLPAYLAGRSASVSSIASSLPSLLLTALPQTSFVLYLLAVQDELKRPQFGLRRPRARDAATAALLLLAMLAILAASGAVTSLLPPTARGVLREGARLGLAGWTELPAALIFCVVAASREEVLFRAYLLTRMEDIGLPPAAATVVTNALFAAAHSYQGYLAVALAFAQGLLLAYAIRKTRSIWVPIAAHGAHNLLVLALTLVPAWPAGP